MGQNPEGVVTATGVMVSPGRDGWVGVMNWFMMISTSGSCQVGQPLPHTSNTVESADSFTAGDTVGGGPNGPSPSPPALRRRLAPSSLWRCAEDC